MPKAINISTTLPARRGRSPKATAEIAAKLSFEPMSAAVVKDLPTREDFMTSAANAFQSIVIGAHMLTKNPTELVAALQAMDNGDGTEAIGLLDEVESMRAWFANFAALLGVIQSRIIVAASRMALEGGA